MTTLLLLKLWSVLFLKATLLLVVLVIAWALLPAGVIALYRDWRELKRKYPDITLGGGIHGAAVPGSGGFLRE